MGTIPRLRFLKLRVSLGLEARHIVCRWREPPEYGTNSDSGLTGRHNRQCVGLSGLRFLILVCRWLTPNGIGYIGPPGLKCATSKLTLRAGSLLGHNLRSVPVCRFVSPITGLVKQADRDRLAGKAAQVNRDFLPFDTLPAPTDD